MSRPGLAAAAVAACGTAGLLALLPGRIEARLNRVHGAVSAASARALELHRRLLVADLHADTLLWHRDLLSRGTRGHVDLPRLLDGGVALQGFTVVTKTPRGQNIERNDDASDNVGLLALAQRWPPRTWSSLKQRALYQAARLRDAAGRSNGRLRLIERAPDLEDFLSQRRRNAERVGAFLGLEGAHALEGELANVDVLYRAGFRMMAPSHFFDNEIAGSAHGVARGGLSAMGREWLRLLERRGIVLDLAHASPAAIDDALALATRPVVVSHTGVKGTCDNPRNLSDAQLRGVARTGGVVGIGVWPTAVCGTDAAAVARAMRHAVSVAGTGHVALGTDFDGAVSAPWDARGMPLLTDALLRAGFSEQEVAKLMGENVLRVLRQALAAGAGAPP